MKIAVIVTTYNRPDALGAVLEGYLAQRYQDFELVVADDGSAADTRRLVATFKDRAPFAISHVWHEDDGFRAAAIRNRALAQIRADYVVFTDGDCVPLPSFVARHRRLAEPGWFVSGNRILLSEAFTKSVLDRRLPVHRWGLARWLGARRRREINRLLPLVSVAGTRWRKASPVQWRSAKTCNLAAWRDDLLRVNGLDERYAGWGLEDSDLVVRLLRAGVKHKSGRFAVPLLHLWHRENDRQSLADNQRRLDAALKSAPIRAERGVAQYL